MKKIEELKAAPGWPYLDDYCRYMSEFSTICDEMYNGNADNPAGSFEDKAALICGKLEKILKRSRSALHHLCIVAAEFQRPGNRAAKLELAQSIEGWLNCSREIEAEVLQAIYEGCDFSTHTRIEK